jgi:hypothetical protein
MRRPSKRALAVLTATALIAVTVPGAAWLSLTHQPVFYREMIRLSRAQREAGARRFVAQSLQLRNDICNEPTWEAVFSDEEVNAWLAEDLVTHFADQIPPGVHEPRLMFEMDRVTLAFELDQGPIRTVVWVVARPYVSEGNVIELTLEKIRAGMLPVPAESILERITEHVRAQGLDVRWKRDGDLPVAVIRYTPHEGRDDVRLQRVDVLKGEIRLAGRSDRSRGMVWLPTLPSRRVLQAKFPRRNIHDREDDSSEAGAPPARSPRVPTTALRRTARPTS